MRTMSPCLSVVCFVGLLAGTSAVSAQSSAYPNSMGAYSQVSHPYYSNPQYSNPQPMGSSQQTFRPDNGIASNAAFPSTPQSPGMNDRIRPEHSQSGHASYPSTTVQPHARFSDPAEERAGLLGSSYLDAQYVFLTAPTSIEYANPFHGVRGTVNTPILWGEDVAKYFSQDVFFSARHLGMTADIPGTFPPAELDVDWNTWAIGTTLFADVTPSFRPFIQLGYVRSDISVEGKSAVAFMEIEDSQDALLVNVGSEFDMTDNLAARIALEIDAPDFGGSFFTVEQIYWCTPNVFLRGGVIGDVDATTIGAVIGGGVAF